jgi:hypothetical protein
VTSRKPLPLIEKLARIKLGGLEPNRGFGRAFLFLRGVASPG